MIGKFSISGCSGLSDAIFSIVVSRRGCSSVSKIFVVPSRNVTSIGDDLFLQPALVDRRDRALVRTQRPRVAVFAGEAGRLRGVVADGDRHVERRRVAVSGCDGDIHCAQSSVPSMRFIICGDVEIDSAPPAITTRSMPAMMLAAAPCTDAMPDAQWRLSATPGTSMRPSSIAA